jgi:hypothetical protein
MWVHEWLLNMHRAWLCRLYGERQALNAQVLHGMQPGLFTSAAGDDGATAAAKVTPGTRHAEAGYDSIPKLST